MVRRIAALPLGTRFRYRGHERVYALIKRCGSGVCAVWTTADASAAMQQVFSVSETEQDFLTLEVEVVE